MATPEDRQPPIRKPASAQLPKPPLWLQYIVSFGIAAVLIVLLVRWVEAHGPSAQSIARVTNPKTIRQDDHDARVIAMQEQAPQTASQTATQTPSAAARAAVMAFQAHQIADDVNGDEGPIQSASCSRTGGSSTRPVFQCTVITGGSENPVRYPFDVVATPATRRITFCPVVYPSVYGITVPVSPRCR
jgi:hypothetical protein